jgi:hypothetical protein
VKPCSGAVRVEVRDTDKKGTHRANYLPFFTGFAGGFATALKRASPRFSSSSTSAALGAAMEASPCLLCSTGFFDDMFGNLQLFEWLVN